MRKPDNLRRNPGPVFKPVLEHRGGGPKWRHFRGSHEKIFLSGQIVPESGIFEVIHDGEHRMPHEVLMHGGDAFPPCDQCHKKVRFKLIRTAPYIFEDADFIDEK